MEVFKVQPFRQSLITCGSCLLLLLLLLLDHTDPGGAGLCFLASSSRNNQKDPAAPGALVSKARQPNCRADGTLISHS